MEWFDAFIVVFASGMRLAVPLLLACLAGLWSERSGIVDIGLEGKMLVAAFAAAAVATLHRQRLARARCRRRRVGRLLAGARLRLDHPARQPDRLRRRDQHAGRRPHRADRQRLVGRAAARRNLPATARFAPIDAALRRGRSARRAGHRPALCGRDLRPQPARLCRLRAGPASPSGCSPARASACGCARSARTRPLSTPPASRCAACAIAR